MLNYVSHILRINYSITFAKESCRARCTHAIPYFISLNVPFKLVNGILSEKVVNICFFSLYGHQGKHHISPCPPLKKYFLIFPNRSPNYKKWKFSVFSVCFILLP